MTGSLMRPERRQVGRAGILGYGWTRFEHIFARLGRWRRLSRCYEGTAASVRAWLEVVSVGDLFARLRVEPT